MTVRDEAFLTPRIPHRCCPCKNCPDQAKTHVHSRASRRELYCIELFYRVDVAIRGGPRALCLELSFLSPVLAISWQAWAVLGLCCDRHEFTYLLRFSYA